MALYELCVAAMIFSESGIVPSVLNSKLWLNGLRGPSSYVKTRF